MLLNKDSERIPKGMPCQLWYTDGVHEHTFDIRSWRYNADPGPRADEFTRPDDRPGWEVVVWPMGGASRE